MMLTIGAAGPLMLLVPVSTIAVRLLPMRRGGVPPWYTMLTLLRVIIQKAKVLLARSLR